MTVIRKFTFDNDFDRPKPAPKPEPEPVVVEAPPPPPPPPMFSEEELAASVAEARKSGLAEGTAKGRAEATAQIEKQTANALQAIGNHFAAIDREVQASAGALSETAVELSLAMTRRLFPELARRHGLAEIEGLLGRSLDMLKTEPRFTVRVASDQREALVERIDALAGQRGFEGRVMVVADDALKAGDCRIEWAQGGMIRSAADIWKGIEAAMEQALVSENSSGESAAPAAHEKV